MPGYEKNGESAEIHQFITLNSEEMISQQHFHMLPELELAQDRKLPILVDYTFE